MRVIVTRLVIAAFILRVLLPAPPPIAELSPSPELSSLFQPEMQAQASTCVHPDDVCAEFSWQVADRFLPVWKSWGVPGSPGNYSRATFQQPFFVTLDGCGSTGGHGLIASYSWTVREVGGSDFALHRVADRCRVRVGVPAEGAYDVALTVRVRDGRAATIMQQIAVRDLLVVSIGDSYASGEGNPEVLLGPTSPGQWQDRRCHRSRFSGPALAALELERRDRQSTVTFLSYACSGATIQQGVTGPYLGLVPLWPPITPQITTAAALLCGDDRCDRPEDPTIDVLLISVGGNDVGFSVAIMACAARLDDVAARTFRSIVGVDLIPHRACSEQPRLKQFLEDRVRALPDLYQGLAEEIQGRLKARTVFITEYPPDLFDSGAGCGTMELVTEAEARWLATYGERLNQIIRDFWGPAVLRVGDNASRDRRWDVISEIASAFAGHGYCATPTYFGHLGQSFVGQLDYLGVLHPNADGHRVYRDAILRKFQEVTATSR